MSAQDQGGEQFELPARTMFAAVADEAFDRMAGLVRRVLDVPVGLVSLVDRDRQVFPGAAGLPEPWDTTRCTPLTHSFCQHVVRSARPLVVTDARLDPALQDNLAIRDIGVVGYAGIPLVDLDGRVVGSLCAIDTRPHVWTPSEIDFLTDLAAACSAELQLRTAGTRSAEAQTRSAALLDLSETLSNTVTTADVSQAVSKLAISRLGATFGGVSILDPGTNVLSYVDLTSLPATVGASYRTFRGDADTPSAVVVRTGYAEFFDDLADMADRFPRAAELLGGAGARASAYLPLHTSDRVIGTIALLWDRPRVFSLDEQALLAGLARYAAQAIERALLLADRRDVASTLQGALLPILPAPADLELVGHYQPARIADAVGGDWYDAFELADGRLMISVGDVEGHDTEAAAVMGQFRTTLRVLTLATGDGPAEVLTTVDHVLAAAPPTRYATAILACVSTAESGAVLTMANAGHLPPLVLAPGRPPELLAATPQVPLGLGLPVSRAASDHHLPPGATLLLFTDGLVERRTESMTDTLAQLVSVAERSQHLPLTELVDALLAEMVGDRHDDDILILGIRVPTGR